jgi:hypothetical protein
MNKFDETTYIRQNLTYVRRISENKISNSLNLRPADKQIMYTTAR